MANAIEMVMAEVNAEIPPQILHMALVTANRRFTVFSNIQQFILQKIIRERVLIECNLIGGKPKSIVLQQKFLETTIKELEGFAGGDGGFDVYRIPPEYRDGMPIAQVIGVQYPYGTSNSGVSGLDVNRGGYNMIDQASEVLNSYTLSSPRNHPTAELLSGDLIKIIPSMYSHCNWLLTCRIAYDDVFTNLHTSAFDTLSDMVVAATKAWIYTNLMIDIDRAAVECGQDIGTVRSIIEEYRDANQQYKELRPKWNAASLLEPSIRRRMLIYQL